MSSRSRRQRRAAAVTALVTIALFGAGAGIGSTVAAWVDDTYLAATAEPATFDIWARFSEANPWEDVGLPGDPDSFVIPIELARYENVQPDHGYAGDVWLCNAGDVDGRITAATLIETDPSGTPWVHLVVPGSIEVDGIDVGTVIPANSCPADPGPAPRGPLDVYGVGHFQTVSDFTGLYGDESRILITITVESLVP